MRRLSKALVVSDTESPGQELGEVFVMKMRETKPLVEAS